MMATLRPAITSTRCPVGNPRSTPPGATQTRYRPPFLDNYSVQVSRFALREGPSGTENLQARAFTLHPFRSLTLSPAIDARGVRHGAMSYSKLNRGPAIDDGTSRPGKAMISADRCW